MYSTLTLHHPCISRDFYITHNNGGLIGASGERLHTHLHTYKNGYMTSQRQGLQTPRATTPAVVKETWVSGNTADGGDKR